ncbi:MAG: 4-phosphoerythronate dehydrogenase [Ignavibacteriaceae bacterium]
MLKIIIDENIAFAREAFDQFGQIILLPGKRITNQELQNADVLIVRSVTQVNEDLLKNTAVKFVGTATIGTDHIDLDYLNKNNIVFADARGCNAYSVAEYVIAALLFLANKLDLRLSEKTIGIVGVGNIGSKVAAFTNALGMKVLLNDPPLQRNGVKREFHSLNKILRADIITFHVPLIKEGVDKTYHILDKEKMGLINKNAILINTSRGPVVDNKELISVIREKNLKVVLDVWENEPDVNLDLLKEVLIGSPHIAGYSWEGKVNGTKMIYNALCNYLNAEQKFDLENDFIEGSDLKLLDFPEPEKSLDDLVSKIYNIKTDDNLMREMINKTKPEKIFYFESLRKNYHLRREFTNYKISIAKEKLYLKNTLEQLRFKIIN